MDNYKNYEHLGYFIVNDKYDFNSKFLSKSRMFN